MKTTSRSVLALSALALLACSATSLAAPSHVGDVATKVVRDSRSRVLTHTKIFHSFGENFRQPLHVFRVHDQLSRRTDIHAQRDKKTAAN